MRVLVTGATGFVGRALLPRLQRDGHQVTAWVRSPERARAALGADITLANAGEGLSSLIAAVESADAVVNLAGEPIAGGRFTHARRERIERSRVHLTQQLVEAMRSARACPKVLISASAVGYYGDRGEEPLDEASPPGKGFLAELCLRWEQAAQAAETLGVRVLRLRIGVVLGLGGGIVGQLLPMIRVGLGARLGNGQQYVPWIHLEDLVSIIALGLREPPWKGVVNAVAPSAARMGALVDGLAKAMGSRARMAVPGFLLKLALGEAAEVVLSSQNTRAEGLRLLGFAHKYPTLDVAIADLAGRLS